MSISQDLYRPNSISELFSETFPNEYYSLELSPTKMHQAIKRLRAHFKAKRLPIRIEELNGLYRLNSKVPLGLICEELKFGGNAPPEKPTLDHWMGGIQNIRKVMSDDSWFTASQLAEKMNWSSRSTRRCLLEGVNRGQIESVGHARATKYRLK